MKKIEAIIKPHKVEPMREALDKLGIDGMTISEVHGASLPKPRNDRLHDSGIPHQPKVKIEVVVQDDRAAAALAAVIKTARNGKLGDDRIFVSDVVQAVRIRTEEKNEAAL